MGRRGHKIAVSAVVLVRPGTLEGQAEIETFVQITGSVMPGLALECLNALGEQVIERVKSIEAAVLAQAQAATEGRT